MSDAIYLDYNASAPLGDAARDAMTRAMARPLGNPSSVHALGRRARGLLEEARASVARAVGARASDVVLTSGGTEACNLGVLGLAGEAPGRIVSTAIEHPAVLASLDALRARGFEIVMLDVPDGVAPSTDEMSRAITDDTRLVVTQWINHETGVVLPVAAYASRARAAGVRCVVDAIQALGKTPIAFAALGASAMAIASHKIGGPPGAGALVVERGLAPVPQLLGGAQERGLRAGSPDLLAVIGFGAACDAIEASLAASREVAARRDALERALVSLGGRVNGAGQARAAGTTNVSFAGWRGSTLVAALDVEGLAVASGAACSSGLDRPSAVVRAMYPDDASRAASAVRFSLGPSTTDDEIERAVSIVARVLARPGS